DPVGEEPVAYEEAYPEPVGREVGHSLVGQERTDTGVTYVNIVDHALRDPEQTDGTGIERTPDDELTSDPLSPRMASTSEAGERIRAIAKVPTDDDPDQSRRKTDGVPRGITIGEHDPVMPNKQSTTQKYTDSPDHEDGRPSSVQCQTSRQASLPRDDVADQVDLVHPSAGDSRKSSSDSTAASLFPSLGEVSDADGLDHTSADENHMQDDPAGKPLSASPRPESCSRGDRGSASTVVPSISLRHAARRDRPSRAVGNAFSKRRTISDSFDCTPCVYPTDHAACGSDCGLFDITYTESSQC
ncbi:hypothetical protein LTS09_018203, partial [Friedmanniomyces endolithicus]